MAKGAVRAVFEEEFAIYFSVPQVLLNMGNSYFPSKRVAGETNRVIYTL